MELCVKYRRKKYNKWVFLWDAWKPLDLWIKPWRYWMRNFYTFGFKWSTMRANICLTSPFLNKIIHWKLRNVYLHIPYTTRDTLEIIDGGKNNLSLILPKNKE